MSHNNQQQHDGDDEIVAEIEVYLSHELGDDLAVLQYPLRINADQRPIKKVMYKPQAKELKTHLEIPAEALYCDFDTTPFKDEHLELSSRAIPPGEWSTYAIGLMGEENSLHIAPIRNVYQMRPSFAQVDDVMGTLEEKAEPHSSSKATAKRILSRGKSVHEGGRTNAYFDIRAKREEEKWLEIPLRDDKKRIPKDSMRELCTGREVSQEEYVNLILDFSTLSPEEEKSKEKSSSKSISPSGKISSKRILGILENAQVVSFRELCAFLDCKSRGDVEWMLRTLEERAILVHRDGIWAVKSNKKNRHHPYRDYLLTMLWNSDGIIRRSQFVQDTGANREITESFLPALCRKNWSSIDVEPENRMWVLKAPPTEQFESFFPKIVENQTKIQTKLLRRAKEKLNLE